MNIFSAAKRCRAIYVSLTSYKISEFKLIYPSPKYRLFYICFAVMLVSDTSDTIARMGQISSRLSDFPETGNIRIKVKNCTYVAFVLQANGKYEYEYKNNRINTDQYEYCHSI